MIADDTSTNPILSSYITSMARTNLHQFMESIRSMDKSRVLFCSTDAVMFVVPKRHRFNPDLNPCIGRMKSEIPQGYTCKAAFFLSSKRYCLVLEHDITKERVEIVKLCGLSLKQKLVSNTEVIDSTFFEELIKKRTTKVFRQIKKKSKKGCSAKMYSPTTYTICSQRVQPKRVITLGFKTHPFGWKISKNCGKGRKSRQKR